MNTNLRRRLAAAALCLLVAAGLVSLAADIQACPMNEVEDYYYSDASHTTLVGYTVLHCYCAGRRSWGRTTPYRERYSSTCAI